MNDCLWTFQQFHPPGARGKLKPELMTDRNWVAEEKYDGDRRIAQFCTEGVRLTGRRISKGGGLLVEKTANLPHLNVGVPSLIGTVLDGEIVCADPLARSRDVTSIMGSAPEVAIAKQRERGWLQYMAFDCLFYKGHDLRDLPLWRRRSYLRIAVAIWDSPHVHVVPGRDDAEAFCREVWDRGGEGIILKDRESLYGDEKAWIKVKREETHDVVVMGFEAAKESSQKVSGEVTPTKYAAEGLIGAIRFGQYKEFFCSRDDCNRPHLGLTECGTCSGFDDETRRDMTEHPEKYIGRVFEITCQLREPSGSFRHPRFKRWRDDKAAEACVWGQT